MSYVAYDYLRRLGRICADCTETITDANKTGRCKRCASTFLGRNPRFCKARADAIRAKFRDDPAHAAKMKRVMRENGQKARLDPAHREWMSEHGRNQILKMNTPEARAKAKAMAPETRRKSVEKQMAWCPVEYREAYHQLVRRHVRSAEAKALILEQVATDRRRARARLSPFERQEADLAAKLARGEEAVASNDMFRRRAA